MIVKREGFYDVKILEDYKQPKKRSRLGLEIYPELTIELDFVHPNINIKISLELFLKKDYFMNNIKLECKTTIKKE
jgi:hypothetical protein